MAKNVFSYCERHNVVSYCFHGKEDILSEKKKERVKYIRDSEKKTVASGRKEENRRDNKRSSQAQKRVYLHTMRRVVRVTILHIH